MDPLALLVCSRVSVTHLPVLRVLSRRCCSSLLHAAACSQWSCDESLSVRVDSCSSTALPGGALACARGECTCWQDNRTPCRRMCAGARVRESWRGLVRATRHTERESERERV